MVLSLTHIKQIVTSTECYFMEVTHSFSSGSPQCVFFILDS